MECRYDSIEGPFVASVEMLLDIANREFMHSQRTALLIRSMAEESFPMPRREATCAR